MNKRLVIRLLGAIMLIEALAMLPSMLISIVTRDGCVQAFLNTIAILCLCGMPMWMLARPKESNLRAREGFVTVALAWVILSAFGALGLGDVLQQLIEVARHGEGLDIVGLLTLLDLETGGLEGEVAGDGVGTGVKAAQVGDVDTVSCLCQQFFLCQFACIVMHQPG